MAQGQIIIDIGTDGATKIAVEGHAGEGCAALTAALENALGETKHDERTEEFYAQPEVEQGNSQSAGQ